MSNQIGLAEALKLPDKTPCNVVCTIDSAVLKTPAGKSTYWNGKISDGAAHCYLSFFGNGAMSPFVGKRVILVGANVNVWNGKTNINLGKRGLIQDFVEDLEAAPAAPRQTRAAAPSTHTAPTANGATIGMCVKGALDVWLKSQADGAAEWNPNAVAFVYSTANQLLGVCRRVEQHVADASQDENVPF